MPELLERARIAVEDARIACAVSRLLLTQTRAILFSRVAVRVEERARIRAPMATQPIPTWGMPPLLDRR
jgi:hypothetical protein